MHGFAWDRPNATKGQGPVVKGKVGQAVLHLALVHVLLGKVLQVVAAQAPGLANADAVRQGPGLELRPHVVGEVDGVHEVLGVRALHDHIGQVLAVNHR